MRTRIDLKVSYKIIGDRKVICYVTPTITNKNPFYTFGGLYCLVRDEMKYTYKGSAVRNLGDANNLLMAKSIAKKKAMRAAYRDIARIARADLTRKKRAIENVETYLDFLYDKANELTDEIIEITKEIK